MRFIIKLLFKIIAMPFVAALTILTAFMNFLLFLSGGLLAFVSFVIGIGGAGVLISGDTSGGVVLLIMAFLISPFGLPAAAGWFADKLDDINYSLKGFITG